MLDLLSGIVYAMCVAWPAIAMLLLAGILACLGEKFPKLGKFLLGDCIFDDDDEFYGENDFYD